MSDNPNKIQRLQLENFTCFERADLEFSSGINVFIGENGTGKTHLLKVMYSVFSSDLTYLLENREANMTRGDYDSRYFGVESISDLKRRKTVGKESKIVLEQYCRRINITFDEEKALVKWNKLQDVKILRSKKLYIPVQEMLSWFEGFINLYKNKEVSFDKTYYDLAVALDGVKLRTESLEKVENLFGDYFKNINIFKKDGKFIISEGNEKELKASVVAQGINKLGQLYYLILNGSLTKDTILFWDEPETGLNPKYIKVVAQFLQTLATAGVQIFVATHDYLLVNYLSLAAEYREQTQSPDMKFFGLYKGKNGTEIETGATLSEIQNDAILEEYAAYYDLENEYFKQTVNGH